MTFLRDKEREKEESPYFGGQDDYTEDTSDPLNDPYDQNRFTKFNPNPENMQGGTSLPSSEADNEGSSGDDYNKNRLKNQNQEENPTNEGQEKKENSKNKIDEAATALSKVPGPVGVAAKVFKYRKLLYVSSFVYFSFCIIAITLFVGMLGIAFPGEMPKNSPDTSIPTISGEEGSVGYFYDFIKKKSGEKYTVSSGCLAPRTGGRLHMGYDFPAPVGTTLHAVYSGTVVDISDWYSKDGIQKNGDSIMIKSDTPDKDGAIYYRYTHIAPEPGLQEGQKVKAGDLIAKVKVLGGPHVDVKKSKEASMTASQRMCSGGTTKGLPTNKYDVW